MDSSVAPKSGSHVEGNPPEVPATPGSKGKNVQLRVPTSSAGSGGTNVPAPDDDSLVDPSVSRLAIAIEMPDVKEMVAAVTRNKEIPTGATDEGTIDDVEDVPAEALSVVSDVRVLEERIGSLEQLTLNTRTEVSEMKTAVIQIREDIASLSTLINRVARSIDRAVSVEEAIGKATREGESTVDREPVSETADLTLATLRSLREEIGVGSLVELSATTANKNVSSSSPAVVHRRRF